MCLVGRNIHTIITYTCHYHDLIQPLAVSSSIVQDKFLIWLVFVTIFSRNFYDFYMKKMFTARNKTSHNKTITL